MNAVQPAWTVISLILGVLVFLGVGIVMMVWGDELIWATVKAMGAYLVVWVGMNYLGALLGAITERPIGYSVLEDDEKTKSKE